MPGLLYPAYQKMYSALSHLERFDKESNFFDNISAIDCFFTEYRNITFAMQASLKHTEFYTVYEKNRNQYLTDHWFIDKRNKITKQKPFDLIKEIKIVLYLPFGGFTVCEKKYSVENDLPLESIFSELKKMLCEVDKYEVCFSVSYSFHEADSDIDLLEKLLHGITSMKSFMEAMEHDFEEKCSLCDQLKERINKIHLTNVPLDFLLINDYTYYPDKDYFDRAERVSMMLSLDGKKVANHYPISCMTQSKYFNYDGTPFGSFTLMYAMLRVISPGIDIMPAIMIIYDDETYDLDAFGGTMKTTMYRKIAEAARLIEQENVAEVCYMSLYSIVPIKSDTPRVSRERIQQSTSDILVCASIDKQLNEKEYTFDGKAMESMEYVAYVMKSGLKKHLEISATNLFPIRYAFEKKKPDISN